MGDYIFSAYGISIMHPSQWRVFFDTKRGFQCRDGFIRIEDSAGKKGAQISLSITWATVSGEPDSFIHRYNENILEQYTQHFKKRAYEIYFMDKILFRNQPAAYIESEYKGGQSLVSRKKDLPVYTMQLAFYHEASGRAVVGTVLGIPEIVKERKRELRELLFSINCTGDQDLKEKGGYSLIPEELDKVAQRKEDKEDCT